LVTCNRPVAPLTFAGRVTVFDPPRELTFEQDWVGLGWGMLQLEALLHRVRS